MIQAPVLRKEIEENGFAIREDVLSRHAVRALIASLDEIHRENALKKRDSVFAIRNLLDISPSVYDLATSTDIYELVHPVLGMAAFPVRGILFDKVPDANWKVPWHQDVTIAVRERIESDAFGPWSTKAGVLHVQPPAAILENMLSVRIHLDDCSAQNGALRVLAGTHRSGRISEGEISLIREDLSESICEVSVGGALVMRPLLLHASSAALVPGHRRVIHIDYAATPLPNGLRWLSEGRSVPA